MNFVDVLCIGYACWDLNFHLSHFPAPDEKAVADSLLSEGGGPASNAAFAINTLGGRAAFVGRLGRDTFGKAHLKELKNAGVDTSRIIRVDASTPTSSVWVNSKGQRALVNYREERTPLEFDFSNITPTCILVDGHELEASLKALKQFANTPSILDAGSLNQSTKTLSKQVTHLVASAAFAIEKSGSEAPEDWLKSLATHTADIAVTHGDQGVYWRDTHGKQGHIPALDVISRDTTAAGDIFHGAFALAVSRGHDFEDSLIWANQVAALSVSKPGGRSSCPTNHEISALEIRSIQN
jgi:sulfofructose kinase